jgi:ankyrin repeat protein
VVKLLLEKGVDVDSKDMGVETPLLRAAESGHQAVIKLLLGVEGVDPDSKDSRFGRTPLSWAAGHGHEAVVKLLQSRDSLSQ